MSSIGDIQQIHSMLQEISRLLDEVDTKTDAVTKKADGSTESFIKLEQVVLRLLVVLRSANIPEDAQKAIIVLSQIAVAARAAQIAVTSLMAASGPVGVAFAAIGLLMGASSGIISADAYLRGAQY